MQKLSFGLMLFGLLASYAALAQGNASNGSNIPKDITNQTPIYDAKDYDLSSYPQRYLPHIEKHGVMVSIHMKLLVGTQNSYKKCAVLNVNPPEFDVGEYGCVVMMMNGVPDAYKERYKSGDWEDTTLVWKS